MRHPLQDHGRAARAFAAFLFALALAACQAAAPSNGRSSASAAAIASGSAPAPATANPSATAYPGVEISYVEGAAYLWDARLYDIGAAPSWIEPAPFRLTAGLYYVTGQCGGQHGKSVGLTILLQQVSGADGAVAQEYRWQCGPVEAGSAFGQLRHLTDGLYRLVVEDATTGGEFEIEPATGADEFAGRLAAPTPPAAPKDPEALASVVPCPPAIDAGPDQSPFGPCVTFDLTWTGSASPVTYRVYESWRMPGTPLPPCNPAAELAIDTGGAATRALTGVYPPAYAQGTCFWVTAANAAGESARVPVQIVFP
jgi:hypothetical protein